jgi:predicted O-methyltransferase YrrM
MADFAKVLARYEARAADENRIWQSAEPGSLLARRDEFLLHVGRDTAEFLLSLCVARGAIRIVELGTSYGYSTLFLAEAARRTGGRVSTYELSPEKQAHAREQLAEAGLDDLVDWRLGDATNLVAQEDAGVDFVLIDLWKDLYVPCLDVLYPLLAHNALIAADNMLEPAFHRPDADIYRRAVAAKPGMQSVLLPIGSGVELSCLWREGSH